MISCLKSISEECLSFNVNASLKLFLALGRLSEGTQALRYSEDTWALAGHSKGTQVLGHLDNSGTQAPRALRHLGGWALNALRHLDTQPLGHLGHIDTWALRHSMHLGTWALGAFYLSDALHTR